MREGKIEKGIERDKESIRARKREPAMWPAGESRKLRKMREKGSINLLCRFISRSCPKVSSSRRLGSKVPPLPRRWEGVVAYRRTCFQCRGRMAGLQVRQ